jgi:hypothetical protein
VKCARAARNSLHDEARVLVDQNRHTNQKRRNAEKEGT